MRISKAARLGLVGFLYFVMLVSARAEGGFLLLELGTGDIDVDEPERLPFIPIGNSDDNALAVAIGGGYLFPSGAYIDAAYTELDTVSLFGLADVFALSSIKLGAGYRIEMNENFSFLAKAGISFWDLDVTESLFFNPGPEAAGGFDGSDLFFEFGGEFTFQGQFGLTLNYSRETYDLGDASAIRIGTKFYFR